MYDIRYMLYPRRVLILEQADNKSALESNSQHMTATSRQQLTAEREGEREGGVVRLGGEEEKQGAAEDGKKNDIIR